MAKIRVMFVGQGPSGLAEDRVVNVFHFAHEGAWTSPIQQACVTAVADFYNGVGVVGVSGGVQTNPLSVYLSPWVARLAELRSYNLEDAKPRTPDIVQLGLSAAGSATGLPEEVACCLTMHGAPPITPRRRGRLYFGPLITSAIVGSTGSEATRPSDALMSNLRIAAMRLADNASEAPPWCIRSTMPSENFVPIVSGYVDNALDTQRRRGPDASFRLAFAAAV